MKHDGDNVRLRLRLCSLFVVLSAFSCWAVLASLFSVVLMCELIK
ncbi:hypothetical protein [Candidatus Ichthyocystis sparus]|nr:hypothetical protein [Candidatus Ichthyocystis sparus]